MHQTDSEISPKADALNAIEKPQSLDQLPETPKPPFDPPRRRSSLAFSKVFESPQLQDASKVESIMTPEAELFTPVLQSNIGKKRASVAPDVLSNPLPGHMTQLYKVFQAAKANLHLDMHFAASPGGSIDSRLPLSEQQQSIRKEDNRKASLSRRNWRYSTMPKLFTATHQDVREPLPTTSPVLPAAVFQCHDSELLPVEPTSSGFASPIEEKADICNDSTQPLPPSSPPIIEVDEAMNPSPMSTTSYQNGIDDLAEPMTGLRVTSDQEVFDSDIQYSPTVEHIRRVSGGQYSVVGKFGGPPRNIFLSQSAQAAADFARAKRGIFKQAIHINDKQKENIPPSYLCPDPAVHMNYSPYCPEPYPHQNSAAVRFSNPVLHARSRTPNYRDSSEDVSQVPFTCHPGRSHASSPMPPSRRPLQSRATAAGSPMPFPRRTLTPLGIYSADSSRHRPLVSPQRRQFDFRKSPGLSKNLHEPFGPSGRYREEFRESERPQVHAANEFYSFSTAAAKAFGESAAPDLRIRDSYRTDTLTPLVQPLGRHPNTGTSALSRPSQHSLYHPVHVAPGDSSSIRMPYNPKRGIRQPVRSRDVQFRSSPPRSSTRFTPAAIPRKRGSEDLDMLDFVIAEDETAKTLSATTRLRLGNEVNRTKSSTRAANYMSILKSESMENLRAESEMIKELSPNVSLWRKPLIKGLHYRKKRRPSYWDDDLEEVRFSPAGRRGIASSPITSKHSMIAELDSATTPAESVAIDEDGLIGEVGQAGAEFEKRMREGVECDDVSQHSKQAG